LSPASPGESVHRLGKRFFNLGEAAGVPFAPQLVLAERGSGPQAIIVSVVLVPRARRLAQLVAKTS